MREIKFRAWINEWRRESHTRIWEDQQKEDASWMQYFKKNKIEPCNDDCILMQYTWLKDKNGKEIYEGDIVKNEYGENFKTEYLDWMVLPFVRFPEYKCEWTWDCEIIWNIYENPELIK